MGCADAITAKRHAAIVKMIFFIVLSLIFGCNYYPVERAKLDYKTKDSLSSFEPERESLMLFICCYRHSLELRSGSYQGLTGLVALILLEVLDEAASQILSLLLPL